MEQLKRGSSRTTDNWKTICKWARVLFPLTTEEEIWEVRLGKVLKAPPWLYWEEALHVIEGLIGCGVFELWREQVFTNLLQLNGIYLPSESMCARSVGGYWIESVSEEAEIATCFPNKKWSGIAYYPLRLLCYWQFRTGVSVFPIPQSFSGFFTRRSPRRIWISHWPSSGSFVHFWSNVDCVNTLFSIFLMTEVNRS